MAPARFSRTSASFNAYLLFLAEGASSMTNSRGWGLLLPLSGFLRVRASPRSRARFASRCKHRLQGVRQVGRAHAQLRNAMPHQPAQELFSPRSNVHVHLAAVFRGAFAPE